MKFYFHSKIKIWKKPGYLLPTIHMTSLLRLREPELLLEYLSTTVSVTAFRISILFSSGWFAKKRLNWRSCFVYKICKNFCWIKFKDHFLFFDNNISKTWPDKRILKIDLIRKTEWFWTVNWGRWTFGLFWYYFKWQWNKRHLAGCSPNSYCKTATGTNELWILDKPALMLGKTSVQIYIVLRQKPKVVGQSFQHLLLWILSHLVNLRM